MEKHDNELLSETGPTKTEVPTEKSQDELQVLRNEISRENPELELLT